MIALLLETLFSRQIPKVLVGSRVFVSINSLSLLQILTFSHGYSIALIIEKVPNLSQIALPLRFVLDGSRLHEKCIIFTISPVNPFNIIVDHFLRMCSHMFPDCSEQ